MPVDALPEEQFDTTGYGRFTRTPTRLDLERFFFLDDADKRLIAKRRGDHNRLGFSLQVVTVRYLGTFLADPLEVPTEVVDYVANQSRGPRRLVPEGVRGAGEDPLRAPVGDHQRVRVAGLCRGRRGADPLG